MLVGVTLVLVNPFFYSSKKRNNFLSLDFRGQLSIHASLTSRERFTKRVLKVGILCSKETFKLSFRLSFLSFRFQLREVLQQLMRCVCHLSCIIPKSA